jgi:excisionase family DNA binding protein
MDRHLSVKQVAEAENVRPAFIYAELQAGRLPHFRHGWVIRISATDFENWRAARRVTGARPVSPRKSRPVRARTATV